MINAHYTLAPRHEYEFDLDEINDELSTLCVAKKPVKILNFYRELPITSMSTLQKFDVGKFETTVSEMHLQVISSQLQTILCLKDCNVLAECSSVHVPRSTAVVYGFQYIDLHADRREAFRLNVDADLIIDLRNDGGRIAGKLVDISVTGCRISLEPRKLLIGSFAVLEILMFDDTKNRDVNRSFAAKIVHTYENENGHFCCLEFIGSPLEQDVLARFLNQKQAAIVRDFRQRQILPE